MAVHSQRLAIGNQAAGTSGFVYSVSALQRVIIKGVALNNQAASRNRFQILIFSGGLQIGLMDFNIDSTGTAGEWVNLQIWAVLKSSEQIKVSSAFTSIDYVISGAELTL